MYELILIAVLSGGFGVTSDANPVVVTVEFNSLGSCVSSGDIISNDLQKHYMVILTSRCVKTKN
jgi:allophanate hydrolase subunit 2